MADKQLSAAEIQQVNTRFMMYATERNHTMPSSAITDTGQSIQHLIHPVSGYVKYIDFVFDVYLNITGTTAPQLSPFAPYNIIRNVAVSLGGGSFQNTTPIIYWLRERALNYGYSPENSGLNYGYASSSIYSVPTPVIGENHWKFLIRVPFQQIEGQALGLVGVGDRNTRLQVNFDVTNSFFGVDQFSSPLFGGSSDVKVSISKTTNSSITPVIYYLTAPASGEIVTPPVVGMMVNIQENNTAFIGTNTKTPIAFTSPFVYLRLWHIFIDGTGAPTSSAIQSLQLDLSPTVTQYSYPNKAALSSYFQGIRRRFGNDMPPGVGVFDLYTGSNPFAPNGTQAIDGQLFNTLQTQVEVQTGTNISNPAKIVTIAEGLAHVSF